MTARSLFARTFLAIPILCALAVAGRAADANPIYQETFETDSDAWKGTGTIQLDAKDAAEGGKSLALTKSKERPLEKVEVMGPTFPIKPGEWIVRAAGRTDLASMDNSYNGTLDFEVLDKAGAVRDRTTVYIQFRQHDWERVSPVVSVPSGAVAGRFVARINKETPGTLWIDELSVAPAPPGAKKMRLMFNMDRLGHLLYPDDPRQASIEIWTAEPLVEDQALVRITDYWGAEQAEPFTVKLKRSGEERGFLKYLGEFDFSKVPVEVGRYYQLRGEVKRDGAEPYRDYSAFAILPEAPANSYKPELIPFTSHSWDDRFPEHVELSHRLGLRITGLVYQYNVKNPKKSSLENDQLAEKLGMGILTSSLASSVERRSEGFKVLDEKTRQILRDSVHYEFKRIGHVRPLIIKMGNEPHNQGDEIKVNVEAYRIIYSEFKKLDPTILVVGSSIGPDERYFQAGFGEWCDAYDFHTYEDPEDIRKIVSERYPELFKKYGYPRPVWATEVGLNSQGMTRHAVASALYKKFLNFFAAGGANISWFSLLYPDPNAKIAETDPFSAAHNTFECRYNRYAPKLDAIAYYNAVNVILDKKPVDDRVLAGDTQVFLFRDAKNHSFIAAYRKRGREDVFFPLPGVGKVDVIRIDGSRSTLDARGKGLTLTINEDPLILLFDGGPDKFPEKLEPAAVKFTALPERLISGVEAHIDIEGIAVDLVDLKAPATWMVRKEGMDGGGSARFFVTIPDGSEATEAELVFNLRDPSGATVGSLFYRPAVNGAIAVNIFPEPASGEGSPGVNLVLTNNGLTPQKLAWQVELLSQRTLNGGRFSARKPAETKFVGKTGGEVTVAPGKSESVRLSLAAGGFDEFAVYDVKAVVRDEKGRSLVAERPMAGFVGVPKANEPPALDGNLGEDAWKSSRPITIDQASQFYGMLAERTNADWKGPEDLTAKLRFLWDEKYLYVGVEVLDDLPGGLMPVNQLWAQDGLQFLIDPTRTTSQKAGKYDYAIAIGKDGPGAACHLSASPDVPTGPAPDIKVSGKRVDPKTGSITYEVAIPWKNLAPFQPVPGGNLGLHLAVNDDDGGGRGGYLTWFGSVQTKDIDIVGDLILLP